MDIDHVPFFERKRYLENPKRKAATIERTKERRKNNPDIKRRDDRKYRDHKEEIAAYNRQYFKEHPEVSRQSEHRRRARKHGSASSMKVSGPAIFEACKWICQLCGKKVNKLLKHPDPMSPSLDHIIPLSQGGEHVETNCQLAHLSCNKKKSRAPAPLGEQIRIPFAA
jgi:5-methylcytosine-specific restriction endonuclease McrA